MLFRILLFLPIFLIACDKPACENKNSVFDKNAIGSAVYNAELKKQMDTRQDVDYWIEGYEAKDGRHYILVEIQAKDMCARALMDITENKRLTQFKNGKGAGYDGAEIRGLKYRTENSGNGETFILEDVERIID